MKKLGLILTLITFILTAGISYATPVNVVDITKGESYSSHDYYNMAKTLVQKYPDILHLEIIGQSVDKKPIYSIIMTENVTDLINKDDFNVTRSHFLTEAGNHSRETVNPAIIIKLIEDYAKDYYNDSHIKEFNIKLELNKIALHFIPLLNPDGHDLVKFGKSSIATPEALRILNSISDKNYPRFKANLRGVDLNRNFPDEYFNKNTNKWVNKFQVHRNQFHSYIPSGEYYGGPYGGSEPETQAMMKYVTKYDFRNFLSFHSRGNVIYSGKYWFSKEYNDREFALAKVASKVNGYSVIHESSGKGSGYFSDYTAAQTLKPNITIETTTAVMPTKQAFFQEAYNKNYLLPLYIAKEGQRAGYFKYRLYVNNKYIRDFFDKDYANAHARRLGGVVVEGSGIPGNKLVNSITRSDFIEQLMGKNYDVANLDIDITDTFIDDTSTITTFAKNIGILSPGNGYFRPNHDITTIEAATIIYRMDNILGNITDYSFLEVELHGQYPEWAIDPIKYVIHTNRLDRNAFVTNLLSKDFIIN